MPKIRINKYLAQHNIASRRKVDDLITQGRVTINNKKATLGDQINDSLDIVHVDNKEVKKSTSVGNFEYYALNKPEGVLSTTSDERGRPTVVDFTKSSNRLYPVGRLDFDSKGLILLTNDGDFAYKLTHPKFHIPKTYHVQTKEALQTGQLGRIKKGGIPIDGKLTSRTDVKKVRNHEFEITLYEGIKRQIRESCKFVGLTVLELKRISIGTLLLGDLKEGEIRKLTQDEIKYLKGLVSDASL